MTWEESAFLKLAGLGAIVFLPTNKPGEFLLQEENGKLRPPGGHWEKTDKNMTHTIVREIGEEFAVPSKKVRKKIRFLGYEYRPKFAGNAVFEFTEHGLQPGEYQASNSKDEQITLVKAKLDDPRYNGPRPDKLEEETPETERAKQANLEDGANPDLTDSSFAPDYTPQEMEDLAGSQTRLYYHLKPHLASMKKWPSHWVPPGELDGWISWYSGYHNGNRKPGDAKQIMRWKKMKARHGEELKRNPTPRRAWMLINWGIDPMKLVGEHQRPELQKQMDTYRAKIDGRTKKASTDPTWRLIYDSEQKPFFNSVNTDSSVEEEPVKMGMDEDTEAWLEDMAREFPEPGFISVDKLADMHLDEPVLEPIDELKAILEKGGLTIREPGESGGRFITEQELENMGQEKSARFITYGELWRITRKMCIEETGRTNPSDAFVRKWADEYLERKHKESKEFFEQVKTAGMNIGPSSVHREANEYGITWDNDVGFMERCYELVGKRHLDDMTPMQLKLIRMSIRKDPDSWKSACTKSFDVPSEEEAELQAAVESLTKWAATQDNTPLVSSLKLLSTSPPDVQQSVVNDLMSLTNQVKAPTTAQVLKDFSPIGTPLAKRPQDWGNPNALADIKAQLQTAGTNIAPAVSGLVKALEKPKGLEEKWYGRVLTSPVNAGFSNSVMNVLNTHLKKKSSTKEALHERVIASAKEGTCPHCGESENMETSIVDGKIKCGGCGKISSHVEWGVSKVANTVRKLIAEKSLPKRWHIVWPDGRSVKLSELWKRPLDANPHNNDPFTPWYETVEHFHGSGHPWEGSYHIQANALEEALERAKTLLPKMFKSAAAQSINHQWTGPDAIWMALKNIDLDKKEADAKSVVQRKLKSKRPDAVKTLNYINGMKKMGIKPDELMISRVPVIPSQFRPYQAAGDVFIPGAANELYRDLINLIGVHGRLEQQLGAGSTFNKLNIYDAMQALYGFGEPTSTKTRERGISGFLKKITGVSPKFSMFQSEMIGKTQDYTARGVVGVDPDLHLDEIGVPDEVLWKLYAPYIQRSLVRSGMSPEEGIRAIKDRTDFASRALDNELTARPVVYSRAPSWHKFNVIAGYPKRLTGNMIRVNPLVTTGMNMDFDGDAINIHLPSMPESVQDAKQKLMPSKMLFSIKERNKVMPVPKQETILGLWSAQNRPAKATMSFPDEGSALRAIKAGQVKLSDEIKIGAV